jgi:hypothetical protein
MHALIECHIPFTFGTGRRASQATYWLLTSSLTTTHNISGWDILTRATLQFRNRGWADRFRVYALECVYPASAVLARKYASSEGKLPAKNGQFGAFRAC